LGKREIGEEVVAVEVDDEEDMEGEGKEDKEVGT